MNTVKVQEILLPVLRTQGELKTLHGKTLHTNNPAKLRGIDGHSLNIQTKYFPFFP